MRSRSTTILKLACLALSLSYTVSMTAEARRGLYRIRLLNTDEVTTISSTTSESRSNNKQTKDAVSSPVNEQHTMFEENSRATFRKLSGNSWIDAFSMSMSMPDFSLSFSMSMMSSYSSPLPRLLREMDIDVPLQVSPTMWRRETQAAADMASSSTVSSPHVELSHRQQIDMPLSMKRMSRRLSTTSDYTSMAKPDAHIPTKLDMMIPWNMIACAAIAVAVVALSLSHRKTRMPFYEHMMVQDESPLRHPLDASMIRVVFEENDDNNTP